MFNWPLISMVLGVASNFFFFSVVAVFSWFAYVFRSNDDSSVSQPSKSQLFGEIPAGKNEKVVLCSTLYLRVFTTRCTIVQSAVLRLHVVCLSVCPSVTLVDQDHVCWKSWELMARTISPMPSLFLGQRPST